MQYKDFFWYLFEYESWANRSWKAYWLDPHGNFHEVYTENKDQGHFHFAKQYCQKHGLAPTPSGPTDELLKRKWVRVTYNYHVDRAVHYDYDRKLPPAPHMIRAIEKKADELNASKIVDDSKRSYLDL